MGTPNLLHCTHVAMHGIELAENEVDLSTKNAVTRTEMFQDLKWAKAKQIDQSLPGFLLRDFPGECMYPCAQQDVKMKPFLPAYLR